MSYIGNTPTQQNFVAGADQFNGNGSTTAFTLSRNVNTVFDIFVAISNVPQDPYSAYSVSGNTLTFTSAPPSGTGNIYVVYRATNVQTFVPTPGVSAQFGLGSASAPSMTFIGDTNTGIYSPGADTLAFVEGGTEAMRINSSANVGIGTSSPGAKLDVRGSSTFLINATNPTAWTSVDSTLTTGSMYNQWNTSSNIGISGTYTNHPYTFVTNNTERMRIDTSGNIQLSTAGTKVLNSSGRPILNQTGSILQVVSTAKTDTFVTSATVTDTAVTGLTVTITPSSTSSTILVLVNLGIAAENAQGGATKLTRTVGGVTTQLSLAAAAGSRSRSSFAGSAYRGSASGYLLLVLNQNLTYIDSPATTSAITYGVQVSSLTTGTYINRSGTDTDSNDTFRGVSYITAMEIAG